MLLNVNVNVRWLMLLLMMTVWLGCLHCTHAVPLQQEEAETTEMVENAEVTDTPSEIAPEPTLVPQAGHQSVDRDEQGSPEGAQHTADAIVEPLTKLAHVTYDSVPVTHKPNDHMPLFHREGHDKLSQS